MPLPSTTPRHKLPNSGVISLAIIMYVVRAYSRLSYGFVAGPGTFQTTLTRPDLFSNYYLEQFRLLLKNHGQNQQVQLEGQRARARELEVQCQGQAVAVQVMAQQLEQAQLHHAAELAMVRDSGFVSNSVPCTHFYAVHLRRHVAS